MSKIGRLIKRLSNRPHGGAVAKRYVFVVTYGRSGSTILMKLINSMNGFDIKGENNGAVQHLIESVRRLDLGIERYGGSATNSVEHPWYGLNTVSFGRHVDQVRKICSEDFFPVAPGHSVGGFKEIRYFQIDNQAFAYHIDFLLGFRDAKIIFLTRDKEQVVKSAWWKDRKREDVIGMVERMDHLFTEAHKQNPFKTQMFDYAQITQFDDFARLASFLGGSLTEPDHAKICARKINQSS